jgi:unsaturated rhamnogalacturonyl hydrolase
MSKFLSILLFVFLLVQTSLASRKADFYLSWAKMIADSEMKHNPDLWMADFVKTPKWDYTQGLIAKAITQVYLTTGDSVYYQYVKSFADFFVDNNGNIKTYKLTDYNIDRVNGGNFLFDLHKLTQTEKYWKAIELLRSQLLTHPRVTEGAFWHKKIYPWQIWLDGLYMASPFYARYAKITGKSDLFNDVTNQFIVCDKYTLDPGTGLNYHAWDEKKEQKWANPQTGQSPHFWGRSMGWYMMALVDVLEYLPENHRDRPALLKILNRLSASLIKYQDKKTKMWYQITNYPEREGNYLESSCTAMYAYAMAKGANRGYLPKKYNKVAEKVFKGMLKYSTLLNEDGTYSITRACSVAGLGGTPYRDGTYEYYISEPVRNDDPKVVGPFILLALELSK